MSKLALKNLLLCAGLLTTKLLPAAASYCPSDLSDWHVDPDANLCGGYYQPPIAHHGYHPLDFSKAIQLSSDQSNIVIDGDVFLQGNVHLNQGYRNLYADNITISRTNSVDNINSIKAYGNLLYQEPSISIWGNSARYDNTQQQFSIQGACYHYYPHHARGEAKALLISKADKVKLNQATFTTCAPNQETWSLNANKITLYPHIGRASAKHIWLKIYDIPVFYWPYLLYPIDKKRHSGFLFPSYGSSTKSGIEVALPFYWNIAPNFDLSLTGKYLSERGTQAQTKFRYLTKNSNGSFSWHILPEDRKYESQRQLWLKNLPTNISQQDPRVLALAHDSPRQAIAYRHNSTLLQRWNLDVLYNYVSDDNYFVDLGNDIHATSQFRLPQYAKLRFNGLHWQHTFNVEEYQVLQPFTTSINKEIYKRQPQWAFNANYPDMFSPFAFVLSGEWVNFNHGPDPISKETVTTGQRIHLRPAISMPLHKSYGFLIPRIQYDFLQYNLQLGDFAKLLDFPIHPNRGVPIWDVDSGLVFERKLNNKYCSMTQTIEPRVYYLYVPYRNQDLYPNFDSGVFNLNFAQLYRDNRFSGRDRVGDTHQTTLSLYSRLYSNTTGQEFFRFGVGQIFYFQNRRVNLCEKSLASFQCTPFDDVSTTARHSNLLAEASLQINKNNSIGSFVEYDTIGVSVEQAAINYHGEFSENKLLNLNYYWQRQDIGQINRASGNISSLHQADFSVLWPINISWQVLARYHYDFKRHETVEGLAGFEYNSCCLAFQLFGTRYRQPQQAGLDTDYANMVSMQIIFKGLSSVGFNSPDQKLKNKIPGYTNLLKRVGNYDKNVIIPVS